MCAGALIFALSDSTIATEKFIVGARVPGATVRAHHAVFAALVALVVPACLSAVVAAAALALAVAVVLAAAVAAVVAVTGVMVYVAVVLCAVRDDDCTPLCFCVARRPYANAGFHHVYLLPGAVPACVWIFGRGRRRGIQSAEGAQPIRGVMTTSVLD